MKRFLIGSIGAVLLTACGSESEVVVVEPPSGEASQQDNAEGSIGMREDVDAVIMPDGTTTEISNRGSAATGGTSSSGQSGATAAQSGATPAQ